MEREIIDRFDKTTTEILGRLEHLEMMVKELDQRTSVPAGKSLDKVLMPAIKQQEVNNHFRNVDNIVSLSLDDNTNYPPLKLKNNNVYNQSKPNLKHYYEDGMPRLDKYLAYLVIKSGYFPDGYGRFLITKDFNVEFTISRFPNSDNNFIRVNFRGLVDDKFFKKRTVQFKFCNDKTFNLDYLNSIQESFNRVIDELCNGKDMHAKSIYGEIKNEFRTIKVNDWGNTTITIENTIYSSYGCMDENSPLYKETIYGQLEIINVYT